MRVELGRCLGAIRRALEVARAVERLGECAEVLARLLLCELDRARRELDGAFGVLELFVIDRQQEPRSAVE